MQNIYFLLSSFIFLKVQAEVDCNWKMPTDEKVCEQEIHWKSRNVKEATATCLEYFPTTFVEGSVKNEITVCKVYRQFQCNFVQGAVPIFDKCYTFDKEEVTMNDYLDPAKTNVKCKKDGILPTFLTISQAKHIAMEAHKKGIYKLWVNIDENGKTIQSSDSFKEGYMLHKDLWKLHKGSHWVGNELRNSLNKEGNAIDSSYNGAKYRFFRTNTDYEHNLYQGSFERATPNSQASLVCEYQAKNVPEQQRYCSKMKALGINAIYDDSTKRKRCIYTTLSKYSLNGLEDIKQLTGCREVPSKEHSSGLDDGTGERVVYNELTKDGKYRVAVIKENAIIKNEYSKNNYGQKARLHCDKSAVDSATQKNQRAPYTTYDHFYKSGFIGKTKPKWHDGYPKDECTDFPSSEFKESTVHLHSDALAIWNGELIDVPTPVRFHAICSIETNVDCGLNKDMCVIEGVEQICENTEEWNQNTGRYAKCRCPALHSGSTCEWTRNENECGAVKVDKTSKKYVDNDEWTQYINKGGRLNLAGEVADYVEKAVIRKNCKMTFYPHPAGSTDDNLILPGLRALGMGEYDIPNFQADTLNGWEKGMATSDVECTCT